ncbi:hypothetical protein Lal_00028385 [Lupinus albus]|nr:hypothetical protein Lal_00028385 [Lupinus albus]
MDQLGIKKTCRLGKGFGKLPATMTRDNLYWLSHDQVALFKTFRGTASRCKQTINHAVPRIKQPRSLLYDILLHCKNRSRIHPKYGYQCQFRNTHNIGISYSNSSATERKGEKEAGNASAENIEGERKEQVNSVRPPTDPPSNGPEKLHLRRGGSWGADPPPQIPGRASHAATRACSRSFLPHVLTCGDLVNHDLVIHTAQMHGKGPMA